MDEMRRSHKHNAIFSMRLQKKVRLHPSHYPLSFLATPMLAPILKNVRKYPILSCLFEDGREHGGDKGRRRDVVKGGGEPSSGVAC